MALVRTEPARDGVAVVTMDDQARSNARSVAMVSDLKDAFAALRDARDVRAVVLTGAGRGFWSPK